MKARIALGDLRLRFAGERFAGVLATPPMAVGPSSIISSLDTVIQCRVIKSAALRIPARRVAISPEDKLMSFDSGAVAH